MSAAAEPKIFKKVEVVEGGGHHGGGWKVAYADFMTAMMAFFLLMWILASSDEQKLRGIAEYFTTATLPGGSGVLDGATLGPPGTLSASNGSVVARGSELGKNDDAPAVQWEVTDVTERTAAEEDTGTEQSGDGQENRDGSDKDADAIAQAAPAESDVEAEHPVDDMRFKQLQADILQAMQDNPDLAPLQQNVVFEQTPEGLHIQIIDQEGKAMFLSGQAEMTDATEVLLANLGKSLATLPNRIILTGHTDSVPFANGAQYDNWDLSTDRANATRRVFETSGVSRNRIIRVSGMADTDPLVPQNTKDASNRRISVMVQYRTEGPTMAGAAGSGMGAKSEASAAPGKSESAPKSEMSQSASSKMPAKDDQVQTVTSAVPLEEQVFQNLRNALR